MEPLIRFSDFSNGWESTSLGNLFRERNERNSNKELLSVTMHQGVIKANANGRHNNSNDDRSSYKYVAKGDIAYNSMRMWQGACGCSKYEGIVSPAYTVIIPSASIVPDFFIRLFKSKKTLKKFRLNSQGLTSDTWNLKYPTLSKILVNYPCSHIEQQAISDYFDNIDTLIAKTSARLTSLKQVKEASLQVMFTQEGETVPRVRFKGFEGEWGQVRLKDISTKVVEKNKSNSISITLTNSAEYGIIDQRDFFDHDVSNIDNISGYFVVQPQDFVYNPRISALAPVGPINMNKLGYSGVMSPLYYVFRVFGINRDFLDVFFKTNIWHKYMKDNGNTGARFDRLSISDELFREMPIYCPKDINEQKKIANYFRSIDRQIDLQAQRLKKLKQFKAACLDKMFV